MHRQILMHALVIPASLLQNRRMQPSESRDLAAEAAPASLVYEQPLSERMRTFLRLDFLYQQTLFHQERGDTWSTRAVVSALLEILAITARGDVRSDVLKELERQANLMSEFQTRPGVDGGRLRAVLANLTRLRDELNGVGALFLQRLRDSEFLNAIKHRSAIPGGTCEFDLPDYYHWLNRPYEARLADLDEWMSTVRPLCDAVTELLWITRQSARGRHETAPGGVFHLTLDRDSPSTMVRVTLPAASVVYPEISGSHHRCSVRFLEWTSATTRPAQTTHDVSFQVAVCA
jgi:cell division protein ZapD